MQVVTVALSACGLLFAAVAAWGAVTTVQLTRELRREEGLRRMREALVTIEHAADTLRGAIGAGPLPEAQLELKRARSLQMVFPDQIEQLLDRVLEPNAGEGARLVQTRDDAQKTWLLLSTQPPPQKMPRWWIRIAARWIRFRNQP